VLRFAPWLAAFASALALAGCGGGEEAAPPTLPPGVADGLATQSESVAELLDAGDTCGAAQEANALVDAVEAAIAAGEVPVAFRASLRETAVELQNEINCPPPAEDQQQDCDALEEQKKALEEELKDTKGKGRKHRLEEQIQALDEQIHACKDSHEEEQD
jgi:TolA-binding protein